MIKILENKKIILSLVVVGFLLLAIFSGWYIFRLIKLKKEPSQPKETQKEKTMEEVLRSLTAPEKGDASKEKVSSEVLKSLTSPKNERTNKESVSEEVLKGLTAPQK
jgi:hypothetical protein